ncbi:MAG: CpsD/CapB family tyrosine-protein kinase [Phycisphaerales bacterium]|nr:CpsD/CapB family tyrosine-protein kinase [Phycisphaerales bacterium]
MGRIADAIKKAERERAQIRNARVDATVAAADRIERDAVGVATMEPPMFEAPLRDSTLTADRDARIRTPSARKELNRFSPAGLRKDDAIVSPTPHWDVHSTVVAARERNSMITEQYRAARTWLLRRNTAGKHACVAITSSIPKEGKSVTTANLAVTMAEVRHLNVLAVDCDLRQGSMARLYKMPNTPGLADVLTGRVSLDEAIATTPIPNLWTLPAGARHDLNSGELMNSRAATRVFDELRERFHYILVDTPPVQSLSDVGAIGALCTGVILVVRMNKTASHLVRQSLHWLQSNHLNVLGCIASDCRTKGARYEYEDLDADEE